MKHGVLMVYGRTEKLSCLAAASIDEN